MWFYELVIEKVQPWTISAEIAARLAADLIEENVVAGLELLITMEAVLLKTITEEVRQGAETIFWRKDIELNESVQE